MTLLRATSLFMLLIGGGCSSTPTAGNSEKVKAVIYPIWVTMDVVHGYGKWINEVYLPGAGVIGNVMWEPTVNSDGTVALVGEANAFFGTMEERRDVMLKSKKDYVWTQEDIELPSEVAREIVSLAEENRRLASQRLVVATSLVSTLGLGAGGGRHPLPPDDD
jgi:hypothetical protein